MSNSGSLKSFDRRAELTVDRNGGLRAPAPWAPDRGRPGPGEPVSSSMPPAGGTDVIRTMCVRPIAVDRPIEQGVLWSRGTVVRLGGLGRLVIRRPFMRSVCSGLPGWRASGRLVGKGWSPRRFGDVDVEIFPWSASAIEIRLARRSPFPVYWGVRRVRRYWALAHAAADRLMEQAQLHEAETEREAC